MKILHAPMDVGGHAAGLAAAERELGHQSDVAVFAPGPFGYAADIDLRSGSGVSLPVRFARRADFLKRALRDYDLFHFNFGQTLLQVRALGHVLDELALVKRAGKTVVVTYQGCDARPYEACFCRSAACAKESPYREIAAARVLKHADLVYHLNPDLSEWLPGSSFLPYASVNPRQTLPTGRERRQPSGNETVVLHAPTNRAVKGTEHVIRALSILASKSLPVRLRLLEGVKRSDVAVEIEKADIVVDQMMLGWYGGFAVEAMALERPVVCFIDDEKNPFGKDLPIVRATPTDLTDQLESLILADPDNRRRLGRAGRLFVEQEHDPLLIARRILDDIASLPPK